ncbi:MAG TPA: tetratricopeptide repeat protein [Chryseolinea sp.]|nr:tetratricopeptide repeat protein [Chryseolinea sp.]
MKSFSYYAIRFDRRKSAINYFARGSNEREMRAIMRFDKRRYGVRLRIVTVAILIFQMLDVSAFAQQADQDFYAPRTSQGDIELFRNVQSYHLGPGREEMGNGRYGAALAHFEFILRYYPNHPQTLVALSELCQKWNSPACEGAATRWFQRAIERNPEASTSYVVHAMHLHRNKKLDDAVKSYKRAIELAPDSVNAHYNLGLAYADLKQYELANLHAQKSYSLGVTQPGLRARLEKAGKWNPNVTLPTTEVKPAIEPSTRASPEKAPE